METLGRLIFGGFFLSSGWNHFANLAPMTGYAGSKNVPRPREAVMLSGGMLAMGGASVMAGVRPEIGAMLLAGFLIPTTIQMHDFWNEKDPMMRQNQQVHFMKNLALLGATLVIAGRSLPALQRTVGNVRERISSRRSLEQPLPPKQIPLEAPRQQEEMMRY